MAGFLYYIPGGQTAAKATLEKAGIWNTIGGCALACRQVFGGPNGGSGIIVSASEASMCTYQKDGQTWEQSAGEGGAWIGYWNDSPPKEADLRRKQQLAGHPVELREGEMWCIPVARMITGGSALPQSFVLGRNFEIVDAKILPRYAAMWARTQQVWEMMSRQTDIDVTPCLELAIEAIGLNYHVGVAEVNLLGLVTSANFFNGICGAVLDLPGLEAIKKKRPPDSD